METSAQVQAGTVAAQVAMRQHKAASRSDGPKVVMPGGRIVDATSYLQNMHRTTSQSSTFADIDAHPEKYLKDHRPGFRYIWVAQNDPDARARIRSDMYIEITQDELLPEAKLPYVTGTLHKAGSTHNGVRKSVVIYDLKLCAVSPKAWDELFGVREAMAVARIASDTERFYADVDREGAVASMEVIPD